MHLAAATSPIQASPVSQAFIAASDKYKAASAALTFAPNERVDVVAAIATAATAAQDAVALLTPFAADADPFVQRSVTGSVASAETGLKALESARQTIEDSRKGAQVQIPASQLIAVAQGAFTRAESVLWEE